MFVLDEALKKQDINISTSGNNTLIAAQGVGTYIAIDFISLLPTTAVSVQFVSGSTNYGGPLPLAAQQALTWENAMKNEHGVITCAPNKAFVRDDLPTLGLPTTAIFNFELSSSSSSIIGISAVISSRRSPIFLPATAEIS